MSYSSMWSSSIMTLDESKVLIVNERTKMSRFNIKFPESNHVFLSHVFLIIDFVFKFFHKEPRD